MHINQEYNEVNSVEKEKYNKSIRKLDGYEDEGHMSKINAGKKDPLAEADSQYYNGSIDDFEKQNPDLAAQCRQFLAKL